jgi:hypothetical protein
MANLHASLTLTDADLETEAERRHLGLARVFDPPIVHPNGKGQITEAEPPCISVSPRVYCESGAATKQDHDG